MQPAELTIELVSLGKKFGSEWVFRNLDYRIQQGDRIVILGGNGSGKSTLLQIIAGYILPNHGQVRYTLGGKALESSDFMKQVSLASPYLELIDEYRLDELIAHCAVYKPFINSLSTKEIIGIMELDHAKHKALKTFSSGMRQRVKLALALLADCPVVLLDEPVSNLDRNAIEWYRRLIDTYAGSRSLIVCSNSIRDEYDFCTKQLDMADHKPAPGKAAMLK